MLDPRGKMRKLPLWGEQVTDDQITFQWPTEAALDEIDCAVKLVRLGMKFPKDGNGGSQEKLYSIQCWLSNGQSSPEFRTRREDVNFVLKKVNFDEDKPIRSISAIQDATFTGNFTFYDGLGKVVRKIESSEE